MEFLENSVEQNGEILMDPGREVILVVDDEETVRECSRAMLEFSGFKVLLAGDGFEAIKTFRQVSDQISCILMDLKMPGKDGEETFREIRETDQTTPVVLISAFCDEETVKRMTQLGLAGVIRKPYRHSELIQIIDELLL